MASASPKMGPKMVALCSAAIGIIYATGYYVTAPAAVETAAVPAATAGQAAQAGAAAKSAAQPVKLTKYLDGTYTGSGTNRIGTVQVAVTIKNDQITDVQITACNTHYPESYIRDLPQQVLSRQNSAVDVVSGATKSTQDFKVAVDQALSQALRQGS